MNTSIWLVVGLLTMTAAAALAQDYHLTPPTQPAPGSPGTSTPQPFTQPTPRNVPRSSPNAQSLLNHGSGVNDSGSNGSRLNPPRGNLAAPDGDLPLLEEQRQLNSQGLGGDSR
jgi:hypothetical protein